MRRQAASGIMSRVRGLPDGWTIERVMAIEPRAVLLDHESHTIFTADASGYTELGPAECVISFDGLCLVRVEGNGDWWMGNLDQADGSIVCWNPYGPDLEWAIRSL